MATLRFLIVKELVDDQHKVVLEYDQDMILSRLQNRLWENLVKTEKITKRKWTKEETAAALEDAFNGLIKEFKDQTITIVP